MRLRVRLRLRLRLGLGLHEGTEVGAPSSASGASDVPAHGAIAMARWKLLRAKAAGSMECLFYASPIRATEATDGGERFVSEADPVSWAV